MKLLKYINAIFLFLAFFTFFSSEVRADVEDCTSSTFRITPSGSTFGESVYIPANTASHVFKFNSGSLELNEDGNMLEGDYFVVVTQDAMIGNAVLDLGSDRVGASEYFKVTKADQDISVTITDPYANSKLDTGQVGPFKYNGGENDAEDTQHVYLYRSVPLDSIPVCKLGVFKIKNPSIFKCDSRIRIYQKRKNDKGVENKCYGQDNIGCLDQKNTLYFEINGVTQGDEPYEGPLYLDVEEVFVYRETKMVSPGKYTAEIPLLNLPLVGEVNQMNGSRLVTPYAPNEDGVETRVLGPCEETPFTISAICGENACQKIIPGVSGTTSFELCNQIIDTKLQDECRKCAISGKGGAEGQGGVWTAVGCISRNPVGIAKRFIQVGLGMGGGVAIIMTLAGGFILSTSQGDPQKANQAKEIITNSVIGILFIIFSVVILQFIGVKILQIPGFGADTEQIK